MRIALCLIKRLGWWCEEMQLFKNNYLVETIPLSLADRPGKTDISTEQLLGATGVVVRPHECTKLLMQAA